MTSFLDSGLGKISYLVVDKLKCRFRATGVSEKKVICLFQFWLKVFFFFAKMRERKEQPNVQIWKRQIKDGELSDLGIFSNSNKEFYFFSISLSGRVVFFYAIDKFHNFLFIFI